MWDLRQERRASIPYPAGDTSFSLRRTRDGIFNALPMLLDAYERYGPVFSLRMFHLNTVWALGPEANREILLRNPTNFLWREGSFADLIPILGDGMLTIDGPFHRASRMALVPAFTKGRIQASRELIDTEIEKALENWKPGDRFDLMEWTREFALGVAMKALLGFDDRHTSRTSQAAHDFETALSFFGQSLWGQIRRGPGSHYRAMTQASARLDEVIYAELELRRRTAAGSDDGHGDDLLGLLLDLQAQGGVELTDKHLRDQVMTMMFAGHDTTTSTVTFLFYELSRNPELVDDPQFNLDHAIDETLRMYPPAWVGPRRTAEACEIAGVPVPERASVNYSSWASHHLPDVWDQPEEFRPERFAPGNVEQIPKGAYVPFGAGSRTCLGMRFGQAEITSIATHVLQRFRLEVDPGYQLRTWQSPTISPRDGMPVTVRAA